MKAAVSISKIFIIFAVTLFATCENTQPQSLCFLMTLSDAQPVQFWVNGQQTFNQKEVDGVHRVCFCQPFKSSDEIKIQFSDDPGNLFELKVLDSDGNVLHIFPFSEGSSGVYSLSFIPENYSPDVIGSVRFVIVKWTNILSTTWSQTSTPAPGWSLQSDGSYRIAIAGANTSETLYQTSPSDTAVKIAFKVRQTSTGTSRTVVDISAGSYIKFFNLIGNDSLEADVDINITGIGDVNVSVSKPQIPGTNTIFFEYLELFTPSSYAEVAFSDCIDIAENHSETILINYSNHRDFAGIDNLDVSPDQDFNLRIPAIFFQERFPQESEVIELSNSRSIQLNAQIKAQRKLKIGPMPPYMHRKLLLALSCQFITIDDKSWVKQESYEMVEGRDTWPLKQASIWLTEKDYIQRNIL